jgi:hypothetical protein
MRCDDVRRVDVGMRRKLVIDARRDHAGSRRELVGTARRGPA